MVRKITGSGSSGQTIKGSIYTTADGYSQVGDGAMIVLQDYIAQALDYTDHAYETYGVDSEHPSLANQNVTCDPCEDGALVYFTDYLDGSPVRREKDFNIVITGADYGTTTCDYATGCACVGGDAAATEGAYEMSQPYGESVVKRAPTTTPYQSIHTGLMEAGHNLSMEHEDGWKYTNFNGDVVETPQYSGGTGSNSCGDDHTTASLDKLDMLYSSCAESKIVVS